VLPDDHPEESGSHDDPPDLEVALPGHNSFSREPGIRTSSTIRIVPVSLGSGPVSGIICVEML